MSALKEIKSNLKKTASPEMIKNAQHKLNEDDSVASYDKNTGESSTSSDPKLAAIKQKSVGEKKFREA